MKQNELEIMKHLRNNSRETLTRLSKKTGIPISTIYERLKDFESGAIKKHTCILDFRKLGYDLRLTLLLQAKAGARDKVLSFLETHHQVNTILRINNGYDFFTEVLCKDMAEVQEFLDKLDAVGVKSRKEYYVLEEVCREQFLTSDAHLKVLQAN
jgi:Lrp/AsnC family transcriptional regulator, leucine-responsive regulatory protein